MMTREATLAVGALHQHCGKGYALHIAIPNHVECDQSPQSTWMARCTVAGANLCKSQLLALVARQLPGYPSIGVPCHSPSTTANCIAWNETRQWSSRGLVRGVPGSRVLAQLSVKTFQYSFPAELLCTSLHCFLEALPALVSLRACLLQFILLFAQPTSWYGMLSTPSACSRRFSLMNREASKDRASTVPLGCLWAYPRLESISNSSSEWLRWPMELGSLMEGRAHAVTLS
ncbi:hypothetical protein F4677DRAFT_100770 [Hypoxylon crocopeplum]|nr:hypothetical protein F4677DRAFT_100770 [Hypoxylon crocopeplum]